MRIRLGICVVAPVLAALLAGCMTTTNAGVPARPAHVYKKIGERALAMEFNYPSDWRSTDKRPVIVFFFGGGWINGSVAQFKDQAEYFAKRGMVAARADYRLKSTDGVTPDACVRDARSAIRWIREHAGELGIHPDRVVASGGSAGGHLAAATAIQDTVESATDDLAVSSIPQALVLFNPAFDFTDQRLLERIGGDTDLARKISPALNLHKDSPPAFMTYGTNDDLKAHGDAYIEAARALGVRAEMYAAPGQRHGFFNRSPWKEDTLAAADKFLTSLGLLAGPKREKAPFGEAR